MAHRLLIRRLWNFTVKDFHCLSASTATSSSFPVMLQSTKNGVFFLSASHPITLMSHRRASFNVQDKEDFTERVINSQLPVLIDFHAQWVLQGAVIVDPIVIFLRFLLWGVATMNIKKSLCLFARCTSVRVLHSSTQHSMVQPWLFSITKWCNATVLTEKTNGMIQ